VRLLRIKDCTEHFGIRVEKLTSANPDGAVVGRVFGYKLLSAVAGELVAQVLPGFHHVEVRRLAPTGGVR